MKGYHLPPFETLIDKLESLPGVGEKTANRLAYHIINMDRDDALAIADALYRCREKIGFCPVCCNLTDGGLCSLCRDEKRDKSIICVVEEPKDVLAFERTDNYNWCYHVIHGVISPLAGIGPDQLRIRELLARVGPGLKEVIMATSPNVEGDATAIYISNLLKPMGVRVTRLAYGMPVGASLEYADSYTIQMALEGRVEL